jgi:hypothetical protein
MLFFVDYLLISKLATQLFVGLKRIRDRAGTAHGVRAVRTMGSLRVFAGTFAPQ